MTGLINAVLSQYFPTWEEVDGDDWMSVCCPVHGDSSPSASVSLDRDAFVCYTCGYKGDAISIIRREEGLDFRGAQRRAEELTGGAYKAVPPKPRKRGKGVPSLPGFGDGW